jgi:hypothetical protein
MRIVPYSKPLGFRLIDAFMGGNSDTFGPNVPFYVKGNIYFGYYGAFVYSFFLGGTIGFTRNLFYRMIRKSTSSILMILLILHLNLIIFGIAQDSQLFISKLFDTVMLSLPIIIVVLYLHLSDSRQPAPA